MAENQAGILIKKFFFKSLGPEKIIAIHGEAGY